MARYTVYMAGQKADGGWEGWTEEVTAQNKHEAEDYANCEWKHRIPSFTVVDIKEV